MKKATIRIVTAAILVAGSAVSRIGQAVCTVKPPPGYCGVSLWPGGTIPYEYDATIAGPEGSNGTPQFNLRQAMNAWETAAGSRIRFVRSPNDPQRVVISATSLAYTTSTSGSIETASSLST